MGPFLFWFEIVTSWLLAIFTTAISHIMAWPSILKGLETEDLR